MAEWWSFLFEHPEDLDVVDGELPGSVWQWKHMSDLISKTLGCSVQSISVRLVQSRPYPLALQLRMWTTEMFQSDAQVRQVGRGDAL